MTTQPRAVSDMSIGSRAFYAFVVSAMVVGVLMVIDMVLGFGIGDVIFSPYLFVPIFVVAYLLTPYAATRLKLDRFSK